MKLISKACTVPLLVHIKINNELQTYLRKDYLKNGTQDQFCLMKCTC